MTAIFPTVPTKQINNLTTATKTFSPARIDGGVKRVSEGTFAVVENVTVSAAYEEDMFLTLCPSLNNAALTLVHVV